MSPTTPTMVMGFRISMPVKIECPMGSVPGNVRLAKVSLTIAVSGASGPSTAEYFGLVSRGFNLGES